jgi:hypothetical protein
MIRYHGTHKDRGLFIAVEDTTGKVPVHYIRPDRAARLIHRQPGMATGYSGSGCDVAAAVLLLEVTGSERLAVDLHKDFMQMFLYRIPTGVPFVIERESIAAWVRDHAAGDGAERPMLSQNGNDRPLSAAGHRAGVK